MGGGGVVVASADYSKHVKRRAITWQKPTVFLSNSSQLLELTLGSLTAWVAVWPRPASLPTTLTYATYFNNIHKDQPPTL